MLQESKKNIYQCSTPVQNASSSKSLNSKNMYYVLAMENSVY